MATTRSSAAAYAGALAVERGLHEAESDRVVPLPWGVAYLRGDLPDVFNANCLWVAGEQDVEVPELVAAADEVLGGAGLPHRWVVVEHEPLWQRLTGPFTAAGFRAITEVVMAHTREPDRPADTGEVEEIAFEELRPAEDAFLAGEDEPGFDDPRVRAQMLEQSRRWGARTSERIFAVRRGGTPVAWAKLRRVGDVAQVEDVATLAPHRGAGLARAVVTAALRAGRAGAPRLLFIVADDEDWPKELYARLGWDAVGRLRIFERVPR